MSSPSPLQRLSGGRRRPRGDGAWPGLLLAALFAAVAGWQIRSGAGPIPWALSAQTLAEGRYDTLLTHMVSHAGLLHLGFNSLALLNLSPPVVRALRRGPARSPMLLRYGLLFLIGGLCAAGLFLALNPGETTPMLGASGAICAFWGLVARLDPAGGPDPAIWSRHARGVIQGFALSNLVLALLINGPIAATGGSGGIAWEAHLGGFLFGLLLGPLFLPQPPPPPPLGPWGPRT